MSRLRHLKGKKAGGCARAEGGSVEDNPTELAKAHKKTPEELIGGSNAKKRIDRKASGGKTGSDTHPYTSAHKNGGRAARGK